VSLVPSLDSSDLPPCTWPDSAERVDGLPFSRDRFPVEVDPVDNPRRSASDRDEGRGVDVCWIEGINTAAVTAGVDGGGVGRYVLGAWEGTALAGVRCAVLSPAASSAPLILVERSLLPFPLIGRPVETLGVGMVGKVVLVEMGGAGGATASEGGRAAGCVSVEKRITSDVDVTTASVINAGAAGIASGALRIDKPFVTSFSEDDDGGESILGVNDDRCVSCDFSPAAIPGRRSSLTALLSSFSLPRQLSLPCPVPGSLSQPRSSTLRLRSSAPDLDGASLLSLTGLRLSRLCSLRLSL
jgi:hypothetical protein